MVLGTRNPILQKRRLALQKNLLHPIKAWDEDGKLSGILLLLATALSLWLTNSAWGSTYLAFWQEKFGLAPLEKSLEHWINDGLMVVFFFLVGLEIKREVVAGELSNFKKALLPILAALGGMFVPAVIFTVFNNETDFMQGWAIPTATDIAFSLGILSLLGKRVPLSLKIFLTALAIIDDLGAIVVIAIFYTAHIHAAFLLAALFIYGVLWVLNRRKVTNLAPYLLLGLALWFCVLKSGVHATIAGVLLATTIPMRRLTHLEHVLHKPVHYGILPVFALANTAILLDPTAFERLLGSLGLGIILGLMLGKPLGIWGFAWLSVKLKLAHRPAQTTWWQVLGLGMTAGIGFTMSIFIANLSFSDPTALNTAKLATLLGSFFSAILGLLCLGLAPRVSHKAVNSL